MHEINIADKVFREACKAGARTFFKVEIGELCEISKEELEEGMRKVTAALVEESELGGLGNILIKPRWEETADFTDWKFEVVFKESKIECGCGFVGRAKILDRGHGYCVWNCPSCSLSGKNIKVLEGGEIKVVEIE
jgi:Zn finger protein HypA/HybF involved in hydrogenase expression